MFDVSLQRVVIALVLAAVILIVTTAIRITLRTLNRRRERRVQLEDLADLRLLRAGVDLQYPAEIAEWLIKSLEELPEDQRAQAEQGVREQLKSLLPSSHLSEAKLLTRDDLAAALAVEREAARKEQEQRDRLRRIAARKEGIKQFLINVALTVFSLVVGWALSAFVHVP